MNPPDAMKPQMQPFLPATAAFPNGKDSPRDFLERCIPTRAIPTLPEARRHDRIVPRNPISLLTLEDGTKMTCRIIDMSLSGAAIAAETRPPLKSLVLLGKVQSRVVRNLEEGFALEFVHEQLAETLEDSVTAR